MKLIRSPELLISLPENDRIKFAISDADSTIKASAKTSIALRKLNFSSIFFKTITPSSAVQVKC